MFIMLYIVIDRVKWSDIHPPGKQFVAWGLCPNQIDQCYKHQQRNGLPLDHVENEDITILQYYYYIMLLAINEQ